MEASLSNFENVHWDSWPDYKWINNQMGDLFQGASLAVAVFPGIWRWNRTPALDTVNLEAGRHHPKNLLCHKASRAGQPSITRSHQSQPLDISHRRTRHISDRLPLSQKPTNPIGINHNVEKAAAGRRYRPIRRPKSGAPPPGRPCREFRGLWPPLGRYFTCHQRGHPSWHPVLDSPLPRRPALRHRLFAAARNNFFRVMGRPRYQSRTVESLSSISAEARETFLQFE